MTRVSKEVQEKTLSKMKERRSTDSIHVRTIVEKKLEWAKNEQQKGTKLIQQYEKELEKLNQQVMRLEGSITVLGQVLQESIIQEKADDQPQN